MIQCTVCGTANDDLALICSSCKSYLRSKIDTLNLFETLWRLIESPRVALKRVVLSQHKNYVFLLSSLLGMSFIYAIFWYKNLGWWFSNIATLAGSGLAIGPFLGIFAVLVLSVMLSVVVRAFGGRVSIRNMFAVVAYSGAPIVFSLVFVFPIEIAAFGLDFFGQNPSPMVIKPVVYVALLGFDVLAVVWSFFLLSEGVSVAGGFKRLTSILIACSVAAVVGAAAIALRLA